MDNDDALNAINRLTAKIVVMEAILRTMVVQAVVSANDPIEAVRDFAVRIEGSLTASAPGQEDRPHVMYLQAEIAEQFAAIEKWVRQAIQS